MISLRCFKAQMTVASSNVLHEIRLNFNQATTIPMFVATLPSLCISNVLKFKIYACVYSITYLNYVNSFSYVSGIKEKTAYALHRLNLN